MGFLQWWNFAELRENRQKYLTVVAQEKQKKPLTAQATENKVAWETYAKSKVYDQKKVNKEIAALRGNYPSAWHHLRPFSSMMESRLFYQFVWDMLGMMLLGMALLKWGIVTNQVPSRVYWLMLLLGYGIGIPLGYWAVEQMALEARDPARFVDNTTWLHHTVTYDLRRITMVLGHMGLVLLLVRSGLFDWLWRSLAAVGQMAFTNYVMHTLICTGIFFGYGLGYYGSLQFYQLYYVVAGIWVFQLIASPIWLHYFRFGPLEWVWRSLTYWKQQPLHKNAPAPPTPVAYPGVL
jgi:uncharacterized protein